ncbi:uncharacterized protein KY384_007502 [Bacidia gigantensis]|uniref:uncharacterized protein n=1 Tax=Bacidia gigantensis TaxID=2732470 RepID=UPI001D043EC0|nr:uncharacterized protein KY384_007502 [Bacidia gigantensis]KAG8527350.1 hypothetical protein KY384_007502 [Bacidia gigantensis]
MQLFTLLACLSFGPFSAALPSAAIESRGLWDYAWIGQYPANDMGCEHQICAGPESHQRPKLHPDHHRPTDGRGACQKFLRDNATRIGVFFGKGKNELIKVQTFFDEECKEPAVVYYNPRKNGGPKHSNQGWLCENASGQDLGWNLGTKDPGPDREGQEAFDKFVAGDRPWGSAVGWQDAKAAVKKFDTWGYLGGH